MISININDSIIPFSYASIDESYFKELAIPIVQGRNFSGEIPADPVSSVIVNQAL